MKWIKYQILQCVNGDETILIDKKVGYSNANLTIAKSEAYNGSYQTVEDDETFETQPLAIELGGTGVRTFEDLKANLGLGDQELNIDTILNSYIWKRCRFIPGVVGIERTGTESSNYIVASNGTIAYSNSIYINEGTISLEEPTINVTASSTTTLESAVKDRYIRASYQTNNNVIFYVPADASVGSRSVGTGSNKTTVYWISPIYKLSVGDSEWEYVGSNMADKYPELGKYSDGYYYEYYKKFCE